MYTFKLIYDVSTVSEGKCILSGDTHTLQARLRPHKVYTSQDIYIVTWCLSSGLSSTTRITIFVSKDNIGSLSSKSHVIHNDIYLQLVLSSMWKKYLVLYMDLLFITFMNVIPDFPISPSANLSSFCVTMTSFFLKLVIRSLIFSPRSV